MNIVFLIIGLIGGFLLAWVLKPQLGSSDEHQTGQAGYISEPMEEKRKNLEKIRTYLKTRSQVTNNAIEHLLGVSDATAERYLDELEKERVIKQVGKTGRSTYYDIC